MFRKIFLPGIIVGILIMVLSVTNLRVLMDYFDLGGKNAWLKVHILLPHDLHA